MSKIFVNFPPYTSNKNSMGVYVEEIIRSMSRRGHEVVLCCIDRADVEENQINSTPLRGIFQNRYFRIFSLYMNIHIQTIKTKPDLIINMSHEYIYPGYLNRSINFIYDLIQLNYPRNVWIKYYVFIMIQLARMSKKNITISNTVRQSLEALGVDAIAIYSHFDQKKYNNHFGFDLLKKYDAIWIGTSDPHKNMELFVSLASNNPADKFCIIAPARRLPCSGWPSNLSHFHAVEEEHYIALIKSSSMLISTSKDEGYGRPPMEALLLGVPILVSDIPVFRELYSRWGFFHDLTEAGINNAYLNLKSQKRGGKENINAEEFKDLIGDPNSYADFIERVLESELKTNT